MDEVKNLTAIKDFFNIIPPANNCSSVKTYTCNVDYETDVSNYNFEKELSVDINISNADYRYVYIHDIDEKKYYTQFQSNFQDFSFDNDSLCLTIKGNASNKKFSNYEIKISICRNKINQMIDEETKKKASELVNAIKENFDKLELREISEKYETEIEYGLGQNDEKKYIGRFFDIKNKLSIWAGYDPNPDYGFNISFSFKKDSDNERTLKNVLQMYDPKIGDRKLDDKKGDLWFVVNLNVIINNTGNIQIGGEENIQKNVSKSSYDSKSKVTDIINNAINIISNVLKTFGL